MPNYQESPMLPPPSSAPNYAVLNDSEIEFYQYKWRFLGGKTVGQYMRDEGDNVKPDAIVEGE